MPLLCLEGNSNRVDTSFEIHIFSFTALCGLYLNFRPRYREQVFFFFFFFFFHFFFIFLFFGFFFFFFFCCFVFKTIFCCFLGIVFCFEFVVRRIYPFLGFFFIHVILAYLAQKTKKKNTTILIYFIYKTVLEICIFLSQKYE
jgi:hypothetical protein